MKRVVIVSIIIAMLVSLTACGSKKSENKSDVEYVKEKGTLVVGITDFAPMDYKDKDGKWVGFDADMAREFAETLGVKVKFVEIDWDNKVMELKSKTIDCVWNGMTLTDEVKSAMECTKPYCNNAQVVVVPKDVADKYKDEKSLKKLNFVAEAGSAGDRRRHRAPGARVRAFAGRSGPGLGGKAHQEPRQGADGAQPARVLP